MNKKQKVLLVKKAIVKGDTFIQKHSTPSLTNQLLLFVKRLFACFQCLYLYKRDNAGNLQNALLRTINISLNSNLYLEDNEKEYHKFWICVFFLKEIQKFKFFSLFSEKDSDFQPLSQIHTKKFYLNSPHFLGKFCHSQYFLKNKYC